MLRLNRTFFNNNPLFLNVWNQFLAHIDLITLYLATVFLCKKQLKNETFIDEYTVVILRVKIEEPV